jgi:hypothetical protein
VAGAQKNNFTAASFQASRFRIYLGFCISAYASAHLGLHRVIAINRTSG